MCEQRLVQASGFCSQRLHPAGATGLRAPAAACRVNWKQWELIKWGQGNSVLAWMAARPGGRRIQLNYPRAAGMLPPALQAEFDK